MVGAALVAASVLLARGVPADAARPRAQGIHPDVQVRHVLDTGSEPRSVRLAQDPRDGTLFSLKADGQISRLDVAKPGSTHLYDAGDHGVSGALGFAIGPDGAMYVVGNEDRPGARTRATIAVGVPQGKGGRAWSLLARTADYPKAVTAFDHLFNGIVVDPRGRHVYVNSGSRTDHGEVQDAGGLHPGAREVGLTAAVFRLPARGRDLALPDDRAALKAAGYVFAEGTRNSFDLAFDRKGKLYAPDNGPDRDMADELNLLARGRHYGFPWRMGGADNPQQFPDYNPADDRLLDPRFFAVRNGFYHNDPDFPARARRRLTEPLANRGPDADSYRDPDTGDVQDASATGRVLRTFTAHRSPLGLTFDIDRAMGGQFRGGGFVLGWTRGDPDGDEVEGPFRDPGQDLLHLAVRKGKGRAAVRATRIAAGFSNPIDAEIVGHRIYVLDYGGDGGLWEVTLPAAD